MKVSYTGSFGKTKADPKLQDFIVYCLQNPDERFWQALRNWSGSIAIWKQTGGAPLDIEVEGLHDTFYDE